MGRRTVVNALKKMFALKNGGEGVIRAYSFSIHYQRYNYVYHRNIMMDFVYNFSYDKKK